ncbi:GGDEF domain-containing protein [Pandoraea apista]|uniref:diguanylate cyclase n=2 Tax=Pandoraea apista TaxID=93218 RepID=A0A0B5FIP4_9BURK|nr:hypothetical protein SG18_20185 [Pandoraea apista]AKH74082.1 hypothetical protein XM39_20370 [Pandoraea apista]AKI62630.1 hypothetical protein AA956_13685 [Pandoraea apista]ALS64329.1 hypothetical protein AT395_04310 [Pandoraea apista]AVF40905.1 GGDEF domain-containing protein [Pandoraea apista]
MYSKYKRRLLALISRMLTPGGVVLSGMALWAGVVALCGWVAWQSYADAVQLATQSSRNLLLVIERDVVRTITSYDLSLQAVIQGAKDADTMSLPPRLRDRILFDNSATAQYFGSIVLLDANGRVLADSAHMGATPTADFSDRAAYLKHKANPSLELWISPPHASRRANAATDITISRKISAPDGAFGGVVIGTINVDYFRSLLDGIDLRHSGTAAIMMTDGSLLTRVPFSRTLVGQNLSAGSVFKVLSSVPSGSVWGAASIDGIKRLHTFGRVDHLPIIIDVAPSEHDILSDWEQRAVSILVLMLVFSLVVLPATFLFSRELRLRRNSIIELRREAHIDPLTGLDNRRTFDRCLQKACAVAMRTGAPLALLFLDFDKFKAYNDTYGHQAGDAVLVRSTAAARAVLNRSTDHFARFGGEEFVAILEGTNEAQALTVAHKVRAAIERVGTPHAGNRTGVVTVSIGVAIGQGRCQPDKLIRMADEALYDAKAEGQNCVRVYRPARRAAAPHVSG